jgi:hypothetical protein
VCCNFDAGDLQLLPQPLEIVKVHEDYKANIVSIKDQVKELLENEQKFACMNVPGKQMKINSINCFSFLKGSSKSMDISMAAMRFTTNSFKKAFRLWN